MGLWGVHISNKSSGGVIIESTRLFLATLYQNWNSVEQEVMGEKF